MEAERKRDRTTAEAERESRQREKECKQRERRKGGRRGREGSLGVGLSVEEQSRSGVEEIREI